MSWEKICIPLYIVYMCDFEVKSGGVRILSFFYNMHKLVIGNQLKLIVKYIHWYPGRPRKRCQTPGISHPTGGCPEN